MRGESCGAAVAIEVAKVNPDLATRDTKGQALRVIQSGGKGVSHSGRSKFIDVATAVAGRYKKILRRRAGANQNDRS